MLLFLLACGSKDAADSGAVDTDFPAECGNCHGDASGPAPDQGAHATHLADSDVALGIPCATCHPVPDDVDAPGHRDGFVDVVLPDGAYAGGSCQVSCHGSELDGGSVPEPRWDIVDGSQAACGACHGLPPGSPHPASPACGTCHPSADSSPAIVDPTDHVDGTVQAED